MNGKKDREAVGIEDSDTEREFPRRRRGNPSQDEDNTKVQELTFGVFADSEKLMTFLKFRPRIVRELLYGFCCSKGRLTAKDYMQALDVLDNTGCFDLLSYADSAVTTENWPTMWSTVLDLAYDFVQAPTYIDTFGKDTLDTFIHSNCHPSACVFHANHTCDGAQKCGTGNAAGLMRVWGAKLNILLVLPSGRHDWPEI